MIPIVNCIIPARMASERVKRKNLRDISGQSLIQHAIDCAHHSGFIDHITVTSDEDIIDHIAGVDAFLIQPPETSSSTADISAVVQWALPKLPPCTHVVVLQPAVLARSPLIVQRLVRHVIDHGHNGGLTMAKSHPWNWTAQNGWMHATWDFENYPRSQSMPLTLCEINAVQVTTRDIAMSGKRWRAPLSVLELPTWSQCLDIDTPTDMEQAAILGPHMLPILATWDGPIHTFQEVGQCE